jgi:predicted nucleic acid-binding protein
MTAVPKDAATKRFVWDTSALLNIKEPNAQGYSPGHSFYKDFNDGWLPGPYFNIYPSIAVFELQASISRAHREGRKMLRDFYIVSDNSIVYPIDQDLIYRCAQLLDQPGFSNLRGGDLIFACIAHLEDAYLVTLDKGFNAVASQVRVIDLNESRESPNYRKLFREEKGRADAL